MKFLVLFFASLFVSHMILSNASATITVSSISGVSADVDLTTSATSTTIYAGLSGVDVGWGCGSPGCDCTSTCDSCAQGTLGACNNRMVHKDTVLNITFTSDSQSGDVKLVNSTNTLVSDFGGATYTSGSTATVSTEWEDICLDMAGDACITADTETLKFGIDTNGDNVLEDTYTITVRLAKIPNTVGATSLVDATAGVSDFALYPGDEKAFFDDDFAPEVVNDNYSLPNAEVVALRAYFQNIPSIACVGTVTHNDNSVTSRLTDSDSNKTLETDSLDADLTNDLFYEFVVGLEDAAGNVGYFFNPAGCNASQHTVQPREVYGLLEENQNCFISTAAYGSPLNDKVKTFRNFRDQVLGEFAIGKKIIKFYYKNSPPIAEKIKQSPVLKTITQVLLWPLWLMSWLVLKLGLVAFTILLGVFILSVRLVIKKKASATSSLLIVLLSLGLAGNANAQEDDFFDFDDSTKTEATKEKPPQEPPYTGAEADEFEESENNKKITAEPKFEENYVESPGENPNKWKKYQRVPDEKRLDELSGNGLFKITKKGEYLYKVDQSPQNSASSVRLGFATFPFLANPVSGITFQDIYGEESKFMLMGDYEWQVFQGFGKIGLRVGSGIMAASGKGQFSYSFTPTYPGYTGGATTDAKETYNLYMFPNSLSVIYRMDVWNKQWLVPYAEAGVDYFAFLETREDGEEIKFGGTPHFHLAAGGSFLLDVLAREMMVQVDKEYGVNHMWLTAEYRRVELISGDFDFTDDIFSAGIMVEY